MGSVRKFQSAGFQAGWQDLWTYRTPSDNDRHGARQKIFLHISLSDGSCIQYGSGSAVLTDGKAA